MFKRLEMGPMGGFYCCVRGKKGAIIKSSVGERKRQCHGIDRYSEVEERMGSEVSSEGYI